MSSGGARAYTGDLGAEPQAGVQGRSPFEADEIFVFKTLIFNTSAAALHQIMFFGLLVFVFR